MKVMVQGQCSRSMFKVKKDCGQGSRSMFKVKKDRGQRSRLKVKKAGG